MLTSIASLVVVLGMLAGLLWWLRRVAGRTQVSGRHIQVIETVALGPGRCLHLVRFGDRGLLLASTAQRCDLICELESLPMENAVAGPSWIEVFRSRLGRA